MCLMKLSFSIYNKNGSNKWYYFYSVTVFKFHKIIKEEIGRYFNGK